MEVGLDFDDALQSYVAKKLNLEIISFDRHFDGVEG
jgi:predicted nucleic acid-binding protein